MNEKDSVKNMAQTVTRWVGSIPSIIAHTLIFVASFAGVFFGFLELDRMLLVLTTLVSLEAIYLAIFIQMTINEQGKDIDEIQDDIDEIQEDVEEIQEDVDEIQEDVEEMQEDVEEMTEEEKTESARVEADHRTLEEIRGGLQKLMKDIEELQKRGA
jgi:low affinity Fe/Cu permease